MSGFSFSSMSPGAIAGASPISQDTGVGASASAFSDIGAFGVGPEVASDSLYAAFVQRQPAQAPAPRSAFGRGVVNYADAPDPQAPRLTGASGDLLTLDPDPSGLNTVVYGERHGLPYNTDTVAALSVFGKPMSRDYLMLSESGRKLLKYAEYARTGRKRDFLEAVTDIQWSDLPFLGTFAAVGGSVRDAVTASQTMKKLQNGEKVTDDELIKTRLYMAENEYRSNGTWGATVGDLVRAAPGFMIEFTLSDGLWSGARLAASRAAAGGAKAGTRAALHFTMDRAAKVAGKEVMDIGFAKLGREGVEALAREGAESTVKKTLLKDASAVILDVMKKNRGLYGGMSDDVLAKLANHRAEYELAKATARNAGGRVARGFNQFVQWAERSGSRAFLDFGAWGTAETSTVMFTRHNAAGAAMADAMGAFLIEAPLRGAMIMAPGAFVVKPIAGSAFGGAVSRNRLDLEQSALLQDDPNLMERAGVLAMGLDFMEFASENAGRGFRPLMRGLGLSIPGLRGALAKGEAAIIVNDGIVKPGVEAETGGFLRRLAQRSLGDRLSNKHGVEQARVSALKTFLGPGVREEVIRQAVSENRAALLGTAASRVTGDLHKFADDLVKTALRQGEQVEGYKTLGRFIAADWMARHNIGPETALNMWDRAGYDGILGEMFEERYADVLKGFFGLDSRPDHDFISNVKEGIKNAFPGFDQLAAEAVGFAVPGLMRNVTAHVLSRIGGGGATRVARESLSALDDLARVGALEQMDLGSYMRGHANLLADLDARAAGFETALQQARDAGAGEQEIADAEGKLKAVQEQRARVVENHEKLVGNLGACATLNADRIATLVAGTHGLSEADVDLLNDGKVDAESVSARLAQLQSERETRAAAGEDVTELDGRISGLSQALDVYVRALPTAEDSFGPEAKMVVGYAGENGASLVSDRNKFVDFAIELAQMSYRSDALTENDGWSFRRVAHKLTGIAAALMTGDLSLAQQDPFAWIARDCGASREYVNKLKQGFAREVETSRRRLLESRAAEQQAAAAEGRETPAGVTYEEIEADARRNFEAKARRLAEAELVAHGVRVFSRSDMLEQAILARAMDQSDRHEVFTEVQEDGTRAVRIAKFDKATGTFASSLSPEQFYEAHKEEVDNLRDQIAVRTMDILTQRLTQRSSERSGDSWSFVRILSSDLDTAPMAVTVAALRMAGLRDAAMTVLADGNRPVADYLGGSAVSSDVMDYVSRTINAGGEVDARAYESIAFALNLPFDGTEAGYDRRNKKVEELCRQASILRREDERHFTREVNDRVGDPRTSAPYCEDIVARRGSDGKWRVRVDAGADERVYADEDEMARALAAEETPWHPAEAKIIFTTALNMEFADAVSALRQFGMLRQYQAAVEAAGNRLGTHPLFRKANLDEMVAAERERLAAENPEAVPDDATIRQNIIESREARDFQFTEAEAAAEMRRLDALASEVRESDGSIMPRESFEGTDSEYDERSLAYFALYDEKAGLVTIANRMLAANGIVSSENLDQIRGLTLASSASARYMTQLSQIRDRGLDSNVYVPVYGADRMTNNGDMDYVLSYGDALLEAALDRGYNANPRLLVSEAPGVLYSLVTETEAVVRRAMQSPQYKKDARFQEAAKQFLLRCCSTRREGDKPVARFSPAAFRVFAEIALFRDRTSAMGAHPLGGVMRAVGDTIRALPSFAAFTGMVDRMFGGAGFVNERRVLTGTLAREDVPQNNRGIAALYDAFVNAPGAFTEKVEVVMPGGLTAAEFLEQVDRKLDRTLGSRSLFEKVRQEYMEQARQGLGPAAAAVMVHNVMAAVDEYYDGRTPVNFIRDIVAAATTGEAAPEDVRSRVAAALKDVADADKVRSEVSAKAARYDEVLARRSELQARLAANGEAIQKLRAQHRGGVTAANVERAAILDELEQTNRDTAELAQEWQELSDRLERHADMGGGSSMAFTVRNLGPSRGDLPGIFGTSRGEWREDIYDDEATLAGKPARLGAALIGNVMGLTEGDSRDDSAFFSVDELANLFFPGISEPDLSALRQAYADMDDLVRKGRATWSQLMAAQSEDADAEDEEDDKDDTGTSPAEAFNQNAASRLKGLAEFVPLAKLAAPEAASGVQSFLANLRESLESATGNRTLESLRELLSPRADGAVENGSQRRALFARRLGAFTTRTLTREGIRELAAVNHKAAFFAMYLSSLPPGARESFGRLVAEASPSAPAHVEANEDGDLRVAPVARGGSVLNHQVVVASFHRLVDTSQKDVGAIRASLAVGEGVDFGARLREVLKDPVANIHNGGRAAALLSQPKERRADRDGVAADTTIQEAVRDATEYLAKSRFLEVTRGRGLTASGEATPRAIVDEIAAYGAVLADLLGPVFGENTPVVAALRSKQLRAHLWRRLNFGGKEARRRELETLKFIRDAMVDGNMFGQIAMAVSSVGARSSRSRAVINDEFTTMFSVGVVRGGSVNLPSLSAERTGPWGALMAYFEDSQPQTIMSAEVDESRGDHASSVAITSPGVIPLLEGWLDREGAVRPLGGFLQMCESMVAFDKKNNGDNRMFDDLTDEVIAECKQNMTWPDKARTPIVAKNISKSLYATEVYEACEQAFKDEYSGKAHTGVIWVPIYAGEHSSGALMQIPTSLFPDGAKRDYDSVADLVCDRIGLRLMGADAKRSAVSSLTAPGAGMIGAKRTFEGKTIRLAAARSSAQDVEVPDGADRTLIDDASNWASAENPRQAIDQAFKKAAQARGAVAIPDFSNLGLSEADRRYAERKAKWLEAGAPEYGHNSICIYYSKESADKAEEAGGDSNAELLGTTVVWGYGADQIKLAAKDPSAITLKCHLVSTAGSDLSFIKSLMIGPDEPEVFPEGDVKRALANLAKRVAKDRSMNTAVVTDFDSYKIGPAASKFLHADGKAVMARVFEILDKKGRLGEALTPEQLDEIVGDLAVTDGRIKENGADKSLGTMRIGDILPNARIEKVDGVADPNAIALVYDDDGVNAYTVANVAHESEVDDGRAPRNYVVDFMTMREALTSGKYLANTADADNAAEVIGAWGRVAAIAAFDDGSVNAAAVESEDVQRLTGPMFNEAFGGQLVREAVSAGVRGRLRKALSVPFAGISAALVSAGASRQYSHNTDRTRNDLNHGSWVYNDEDRKFYGKWTGARRRLADCAVNCREPWFRHGTFIDESKFNASDGTYGQYFQNLGETDPDRVKVVAVERMFEAYQHESDEARRRELHKRICDVLVDHKGQALDPKAAEKLSFDDLFVTPNQTGASGRAFDRTAVRTGSTDRHGVTAPQGVNSGIYLAGTMFGLPRTPSYNGSMWLQVVRASVPVTEDQRDALVAPDPQTLKILGCDHDGDKSRLYMARPNADGVVDVLQMAGDTSLDAEWLTDHGWLERDPATSRLSISKDARRQASNAFVRGLFSMAAAIPVGEAEGYTFVGGPASQETSTRPVAKALFKRVVEVAGTPYFDLPQFKANNTLGKARLAAMISASAERADKARGRAVSLAAALHFMWANRKMFPGYMENVTADQWFKFMRMVDGISNATFDDIKEQMCSRLGWTPEMMPVLIADMLGANGEGVPVTEKDFANRLVKYVASVSGRPIVKNAEGDWVIDPAFNPETDQGKRGSRYQMLAFSNVEDKQSALRASKLFGHEKGGYVTKRSVMDLFGLVHDKESGKDVFSADVLDDACAKFGNRKPGSTLPRMFAAALVEVAGSEGKLEDVVSVLVESGQPKGRALLGLWFSVMREAAPLACLTKNGGVINSEDNAPGTAGLIRSHVLTEEEMKDRLDEETGKVKELGVVSKLRNAARELVPWIVTYKRLNDAMELARMVNFTKVDPGEDKLPLNNARRQEWAGEDGAGGIARREGRLSNWSWEMEQSAEALGGNFRFGGAVARSVASAGMVAADTAERGKLTSPPTAEFENWPTLSSSDTLRLEANAQTVPYVVAALQNSPEGPEKAYRRLYDIAMRAARARTGANDIDPDRNIVFDFRVAVEAAVDLAYLMGVSSTEFENVGKTGNRLWAYLRLAPDSSYKAIGTRQNFGPEAEGLRSILPMFRNATPEELGLVRGLMARVMRGKSYSEARFPQFLKATAKGERGRYAKSFDISEANLNDLANEAEDNFRATHRAMSADELAAGAKAAGDAVREKARLALALAPEGGKVTLAELFNDILPIYVAMTARVTGSVRPSTRSIVDMFPAEVRRNWSRRQAANDRENPYASWMRVANLAPTDHAKNAKPGSDNTVSADEVATWADTNPETPSKGRRENPSRAHTVDIFAGVHDDGKGNLTGVIPEIASAEHRTVPRDDSVAREVQRLREGMDKPEDERTVKAARAMQALLSRWDKGARVVYKGGTSFVIEGRLAGDAGGQRVHITVDMGAVLSPKTDEQLTALANNPNYLQSLFQSMTDQDKASLPGLTEDQIQTLANDAGYLKTLLQSMTDEDKATFEVSDLDSLMNMDTPGREALVEKYADGGLLRLMNADLATRKSLVEKYGVAGVTSSKTSWFIDGKGVATLIGEIRLSPDAHGTAIYHEYFHTMLRMFRDIGLFSAADDEALTNEFHDENGNFDEEAAAEAFRKFVEGLSDYGSRAHSFHDASGNFDRGAVAEALRAFVGSDKGKALVNEFHDENGNFDEDTAVNAFYEIVEGRADSDAVFSGFRDTDAANAFREFVNARSKAKAHSTRSVFRKLFDFLRSVYNIVMSAMFRYGVDARASDQLFTLMIHGTAQMSLDRADEVSRINDLGVVAYDRQGRLRDVKSRNDSSANISNPTLEAVVAHNSKLMDAAIESAFSNTPEGASASVRFATIAADVPGMVDRQLPYSYQVPVSVAASVAEQLATVTPLADDLRKLLAENGGPARISDEAKWIVNSALREYGAQSGNDLSEHTRGSIEAGPAFQLLTAVYPRLMDRYVGRDGRLEFERTDNKVYTQEMKQHMSVFDITAWMDVATGLSPQILLDRASSRLSDLRDAAPEGTAARRVVDHYAAALADIRRIFDSPAKTIEYVAAGAQDVFDVILPTMIAGIDAPNRDADGRFTGYRIRETKDGDVDMVRNTFRGVREFNPALPDLRSCINEPVVQQALSAALSAAFTSAAQAKFYRELGIVPLNEGEKVTVDEMKERVRANVPEPLRPVDIAEDNAIGAWSFVDGTSFTDFYDQPFFSAADPTAWLASQLPSHLGKLDPRELVSGQHREFADLRMKAEDAQNLCDMVFGLDTGPNGKLLRVVHDNGEYEIDHGEVKYVGERGRKRFGFNRYRNDRLGEGLTEEDQNCVATFLQMLANYARGGKKLVFGVDKLKFYRTTNNDPAYYVWDKVKERLRVDENGVMHQKNQVDPLDMAVYRMHQQLHETLLNRVESRFVEAVCSVRAEAVELEDRLRASSDGTTFDFNDYVLRELERGGFVIGHRRRVASGTAVVTDATFVMDVDDVDSWFKTTDAYRKLREAGRDFTVEVNGRELDILSREYWTETFMAPWREAARHAMSLPWLRDGDGKFFHMFGTKLPLFVGSGYYMYHANRLERNAQTSVTDEKLRQYEESFLGVLSTKFAQTPVGALTDEGGTGAMQIVVDRFAPGTNMREFIAAVTAGTYEEGSELSEKSGLVLPSTATGADVARAVYNVLVQRQIGAPAQEVAEGFTDRDLVALYERHELDNTSVFAGNQGLTDEQHYKQYGVLPANMQLGHAVRTAVNGLADAYYSRNVLANMLMTPNADGTPVYFLKPSADAAVTSGLPDMYWQGLAQWWSDLFSGGKWYDPAKSGVENCRDMYDRVVAANEAKGNGRTVRFGSGEKHVFHALPPDEMDSASVEQLWYVEDERLGEESSALNALGHGEAGGYARQFFTSSRCLGRGATRSALHRALSWSKTMSVSFSLFFPLATRWESPIGALGAVATIGSNTSLGDIMRKNPELFNGIQKIFGGSGWITQDFLPMRKIVEAMDTDDPFLAEMKSWAAMVGVPISNRLVNPLEDANAVVAEDLKRLKAIVKREHGAKAAAEFDRLTNVALVRGGDRAFSYVLNATKMAVVAQLAMKLRHQAKLRHKAFDPIRDLRKYADYINAEIGGLDPLRYAWAHPKNREIMNTLFFSWQWTRGAWEAGGGKLVEEALFGGNTLTPQERDYYLGRWARMFGTVMIGVPAVAQIGVMALAKAIEAMTPPDDDDELTGEEFRRKHGRARNEAEMQAYIEAHDARRKDVWFTWQNESKAAYTAFDLTPLLRAVSRFDDTRLGGRLRRFKERGGAMTGILGAAAGGAAGARYFGGLGGMLGAAGGALVGSKLPSLVPMYTGDDPSNTSRNRRFYMHFGKQGWEEVRWFRDPRGQFFSKLSMPTQRLVEGVLGRNLSFLERGLPWDEMNWLERWNPVNPDGAFWNLASAFTPFVTAGVSRTGDAGALTMLGPVSMGVAGGTASKKLEKALSEWARNDRRGYSFGVYKRGKKNPKPFRNKVGDILADAVRNGYDPDRLMQTALRNALSAEYRRFAAAMPKDPGGEFNMREVARAARAINRLGGRIDGVTNAMKKRLADRGVRWEALSPEARATYLDVARGAIRDPYRAVTGEARLPGLETREAANGGAALGNFLATDKIPDTVFGIKVVQTPEEYTEQDLKFFKEHPRAAGFYELEGDTD